MLNVTFHEEVAQKLSNKVNNDPESHKTIGISDDMLVTRYVIETKAQSSEWGDILNPPDQEKLK